MICLHEGNGLNIRLKGLCGGVKTVHGRKRVRIDRPSEKKIMRVRRVVINKTKKIFLMGNNRVDNEIRRSQN